jgi:hypothetical protein
MIRQSAVTKAAFLVGILIMAIELSGEQSLRHPILKSQSTRLQQQEATSLLSEFCTDMKFVAGVGLECSTKTSGPSFSDITDLTFHPVGILRGHFLEPNSEDVIVHGWSVETHPDLWGGTLLLSNRNGKWLPAWYKSSLITSDCEKVALRSGRQILLCDVEDGGMGHEFQYLYSVDLKAPAKLRDSILAQSDSFKELGDCNAQHQNIDLVQWGIGRRSLSVVVHTTAFLNSFGSGCAGNSRRERPLARRVLRFVAGDQGFQAAP